MSIERVNILIIGTLASGSSALADMLKEYENVNALPREFDTFRRPGMVYDQLSSETSRDYPNVIEKEIIFDNRKWELVYRTNLWRQFSGNHLKEIWEKDWGKFSKYKESLIRLYHIHYLIELNKVLKSDVNYTEKIRHANYWIRRIGLIYPSKFDYTLYNQPLFPWFDINIWSEVFKPFKLICVHRDPKDQIAEMMKREITFSPFRSAQISYGQFNIASIYGNNRKGRFRFMADALKKRFEIYDEWMRILGNDQFLLIDFEGLVNCYDKYESKIEQFLGLTSESHKFRKLNFNPEVAKQNSVGIFKKWLNNEEIKELEELEEWYLSKCQISN